MAKQKERSIFWVVSTHVLTTGFVMPLLAYVAAFALIAATPLTFLLSSGLQMSLFLGIQGLGYVGGVYYSMAYIRKVAIIRQPLACITPSITTFAILAGAGLFLNLLSRPGPMFLILLIVFYVAITLVFAFVTRQGFRGMAEAPAGFPVRLVQMPVPVQPLDPSTNRRIQASRCRPNTTAYAKLMRCCDVSP